MLDDTDVLWNLYQEHCEWERHHETQRAAATSMLLAIAAAVLGFLTFDQKLNLADLPLTLYLITQGVFGAVFCAKHYERFCMHQARANAYRAAMDSRHPDLRIIETRNAADRSVAQRFRRVSRLRLNHLWLALHITIGAFGLVLTAAACMRWFG